MACLCIAIYEEEEAFVLISTRPSFPYLQSNILIEGLLGMCRIFFPLMSALFVFSFSWTLPTLSQPSHQRSRPANWMPWWLALCLPRKGRPSSALPPRWTRNTLQSPSWERPTPLPTVCPILNWGPRPTSCSIMPTCLPIPTQIR